MNTAAITAEIIRQVEERGPGKSICPSEVAQALAPENWRGLLTLVRQAAAALAAEGQIDILRKGKPVAPEDMRGVIRLAIRQKEPE